MTEEKKIIFDEDWKNQAQNEKEKLEDKKTSTPEIPANMMVLINSLVIQAMLYLGKLQHPDNPEGAMQVDLVAARHHIDMLALLEEKTKGNLSEEEKQMLSQALHQMRMLYVQVASENK